MNPLQMAGALTWVNAAENQAQQQERLNSVIDSFVVMDQGGTPAKHNDRADAEFEATGLDSRIPRHVAAAYHRVPGQHEGVPVGGDDPATVDMEYDQRGNLVSSDYDANDGGWFDNFLEAATYATGVLSAGVGIATVAGGAAVAGNMAAGSSMASGIGIASAGVGLAGAVKSGDPLGIIGAAAGFVGALPMGGEGLGRAMGTISSGIRTAQAIEAGDPMGIVQGAMGGSCSPRLICSYC